MSDFPWLTERPIAHRGLHNAAKGLIENSVGAARAAVAAGYAIECDVQATKDGGVVVFHDDGLERLTGRSGEVNAFTTRTLADMTLTGTHEKIPTLEDFLAAIGGRTPLVIELKSRFDGSLAAARRVAELLSGYEGPVVIESFDPEPIGFLRERGAEFGIAHVPLGMVAEAAYDAEDWRFLSPAQRQEMTHFLHYRQTLPDFISWNVADLPHAIPLLTREGLGLPVTTWTVRSAEQAAAARAWADQIVFEGFTP